MSAIRLFLLVFCCSVLLIHNVSAESGLSLDHHETNNSTADCMDNSELPTDTKSAAFSPLATSSTPPINDDCDNAIPLFGDGILECGESEVALGDACATGDVEATGNCVDPSDPGVWYTFEAPLNMGYGTVVFEWINTGTTSIELFSTTSDCSDLNYINCNFGTLHWDLEPGTTYYILIYGDYNIFALDPSFDSACDDPNTFFLGGGNWHASTNSCADPSSVVPCQGENVMWYNFVANQCPASDIEFSLIPSAVAGVSGMDDGSISVFLPDCTTLASQYDLDNQGYVCSTIILNEVLVLEDIPPGTELLIAVGSGYGNSGFYVLGIMETPGGTGAPQNDECDVDVPIVVAGINPNLTNVCATQDIIIPSCPSESEATVWFEYEPPFPQDITVNVLLGDLVSPAIAGWDGCNGNLLVENCGTSIEMNCISDPLLIEVGSALDNTGTFELEIISTPALAPPLPELTYTDICSETELSFLLEFLGGLSGDITVSIDPSSSSSIIGMNEHTFTDVSSAEVKDILINCSSLPAEAIYEVSSSVPGFTCPGNPTQVSILVNPKFTEKPAEVEACLPFLLELEATDLFSGGQAPYASFEWLWNGSPLATSALLMYDLEESGDLTLEVTDAAGCSWESMIEVTTSPVLEPVLTTGLADLCFGPAGTFVNLELMSAGIIDDVEWFILDAYGNEVELGEGDNLGYYVEEFNSVGSYTVQAIIEDPVGCEGESNELDLFIYPTPNGALVVEPGSNCQSILQVVFYGLNGEDVYENGPDSNGDGLPDIFDLDNDGVADFDEITWTDPNLGMISSSDLFYTISFDGTYSVELITDEDCASNIAPLAVTLGNQISPKLIGPNTFCKGDSIVMFVSPSGLSGYNWTVNDNDVTGAYQDTLRLLPTDTTDIILMVEDAQGCIFTIAKQVLPLERPAFIIQGSSSICPGVSALISILPETAIDTNGWSLVWRNFANDSIAFGSSVSLSSAGDYSLSVTTADGCTASEIFSISEDADLNITIRGEDFCLGENSILSAGGGYDTYTWFDEQGMLLGTEEHLVVTKGGEYSLAVTLGSCAGEDALIVKAVLPPMIALPATVEVCNNPNTDNSLDLSALIAGGDIGLWSSSQLTTLDLSEPGSVSFESVPVGSYELRYTTTTAVPPCVDVSQDMTVEVVDCPCPDFNIDNFRVLCNTTPSFLLNDQLGAGGVFRTWSFLDGPATLSIDADKVIETQYVQPGEYQFLYTIDTTVLGCPDTDTLFLIIIEPPIASLVSVATVCSSTSTVAPTDLNLDDLILQGRGEWIDPLISGLNFSDPQNLNFENVVEGNYTLTFMTSDADLPCLNYEVDVALTVLNCDCPIIDLGADLDLCNDTAVIDLAASSASSADGDWTALTNNPQPVSIINNQVDLTGLLSGSYAFEFILTVPNPSCPHSDTLIVQLYAPPLLSPFMDTVVCNRNLGTKTTILDLAALVIGDYGEWLDPQISGLDISDPAQVDFAGLPLGSYSFIHLTNSATAPCIEVAQTLIVDVEDCSCPVLELDSSMALCNDAASVDLSLSIGNSATGNWTESNTNPTSSLEQNNEVELTGAAAGNYQFFYRLMDPIIGCPEMDTMVIELNAAPQLVLIDTVVCNVNQGNKGTVLDFSKLVVSTGGEWTDPVIAGLDFSDLNNIDFAGLTPGQYNFPYATNTALFPCMDEQVDLIITVLDCNCPIIELDQGQGLCLGDLSLDLSLLSGLSAPGTWVADNANLEDIQISNDVADFSEAVVGDYVFIYELNDLVQGCESEGSITVSVFAPPVIEETRDTMACSTAFGGMGTMIDLTQLVAGDNGFFIDADGDPVIIPEQFDCEGLEVGSEILITYMTATAMAPCQEVSEILIISIIDCSCDNPVFLDPPTLCNGVDEVVDLNNLLLSAHEGTWTLVDQPQSSEQSLEGSELSYLNIQSGIYRVEFNLAVPVDGCPSSWIFDLTVVQQEGAEVVANAEICIEALDQGTYDLEAALTRGSDKGYWVDPSGDQIDELTLLFKPGEEGSYLYTYLVENALPCAPSSYDLDLKVITCTSKVDTLVYVPNIIGGENDTESLFYVQSNIEALNIKSLSIYDRWGEMVFQLKDVPVNTTTWGWDGTFNGREVEQGVYVYVLEIEGSKELIVDDLTVFR